MSLSNIPLYLPRFAYHMDGASYANKPCCWQVLECGVDFSSFTCSSGDDSKGNTLSTVFAGRTPLYTCEDMLEYS